MTFDYHSKEAYGDLEQIAKYGFETIKNITEDCTKDVQVWDMYYDYLFDVIKNEFESLESVTHLMEKRKYKDCFSILRTVFEMMLYFWLMVHGKKYQFYRTWTITPELSQSPVEARDKTFDLWHKHWKDGDSNYKDVIKMQKNEDDKILLISEHEGLYEKDKESEKDTFIPHYFFMLTDHYDQFVRFNSELPSIKTGRIRSDDKEEEFLHRQKIFYSKYIRIEAIIKNLRLNNLINEIQRDYIIVHYNYLSSFVHPSREFFQFSENSGGFIKSDIPDYLVKEQILLYVCRIQYFLLKILLDRIAVYNSKADLVKYREFMEMENQITSYFWFIDNEPTEYDTAKSENNKKFAERFGHRTPDDVIMYYQDPIRRLQELKLWR